MKDKLKTAVAGGLAGAINGLFGAGGGMVLVPLLSTMTDIGNERIFPTSVSIILPICLVSLAVRMCRGPLPIHDAWPYMLGSVAGGLLAGKFGDKIPALWLHRILGVLILWGGFRYLWS